MFTCKIDGCGGPIYVKSAALCSRHYNRLKQTGTTDDGPRARLPLSERFWAQVDRRGDDDCWPWLGKSQTYGYGVINIGGRGAPKVQSNRVAWMLTCGDIPDGAVVRHKCHNRACCNPAHLMLGTRADNVQDMWDREDGAPKGNARLTRAQVLEIRNSLRSRQELSKAYGVCPEHINAIKLRRVWRDI